MNRRPILPRAHVAIPERRRAARLWRDASGVSLVEFAIVVAPAIALILAALQTSLLYFAQEALETAVEATARTVVTGQAQASDIASPTLTQTQLAARFKQAACTRLPAFMRCANLIVDVRSAGSWTSMDTSMTTVTYDQNGNPNPMSYSLGSQGSVVLVRLIYLWPIQTGPLGLNFGNQSGNRRLIVATSVAKTENYS